MIAMLSGILVDSNFSRCVVDVNGVGYEVEIPLSTFDQLPLPGQAVKLLIHTQVREDAITLFGFKSLEERDFFRILTGISGIGGKLALNIIGAMPLEMLCQAIASGDVKSLSRINGIGKRTAERLVVELKDKVNRLSGIKTSGGGLAVGAAADAAAALETLGFKSEAVNKTITALLSELPVEQQTTEQLVRLALARLNS